MAQPTLLSFFEHVNQGVDATVLPRWAGTEEIEKAMVGVGDSIDLVNTKFNTIYDSDYTNNLLPHKDDCDNGIVLMVMNSSSYPKEEVPQFIIDYSEPSDNSSTIGMITDDCHNLIRDQIDYFEALRNPLANFIQGSAASGSQIILTLLKVQWMTPLM